MLHRSIDDGLGGAQDAGSAAVALQDRKRVSERSLILSLSTGSALRIPLVEALAGLYAQLALGDAVPEAGRRGLVVRQGVVHRRRGRGMNVQPRQVLLQDGTGREVAEAEAEPDRVVDVLGGGEALLDQRERLAHEGVLQAVRQEPR